MTLTHILLFILILFTVLQITVFLALFDLTNKIHRLIENKKKLDNDRFQLHTKQIELYKKIIGE